MTTALGPKCTASSKYPYTWAPLSHFTEGQSEAQAQGHPVVKDKTRAQATAVELQSLCPSHLPFRCRICAFHPHYPVSDFSVQLPTRGSTDAAFAICPFPLQLTLRQPRPHITLLELNAETQHKRFHRRQGGGAREGAPERVGLGQSSLSTIPPTGAGRAGGSQPGGSWEHQVESVSICPVSLGLCLLLPFHRAHLALSPSPRPGVRGEPFPSHERSGYSPHSAILWTQHRASHRRNLLKVWVLSQ